MMTSMQRFLKSPAPSSRPDPSTESTPLTDLGPRLYDEVMRVAQAHPFLKMEDYDLEVVRTQIIDPIAAYISAVLAGRASATHQPPLIVSGDPGIGKTTLLMMIDQALTQLDLPQTLSCRALFAQGGIAGYYGAFKGTIDITPLKLQTTPTAVLSILDWRNIQRHWTYDNQKTHRETPEATADFLKTFQGKVLFVDDAEREGHVYVISQLARQGILVVLSSNLDHTLLHIDDLSPRAVHLVGKDHRVGDIAAVGVPQAPHLLFDALRHDPNSLSHKYDRWKIIQRGGQRVAYTRWDSVKDQPYLKDTFAEYFRQHRVSGVVLDDFPFFAGMTGQDIDPSMLGRLYRFVHLIDAIHDLQLPFMLRMTRALPLVSDYKGAEIETALRDYDTHVSGQAGATAWIEMSRALSRLRSRQALNAAFFPTFLSQPTDQGDSL
jgi:hypothetical protein